jgi:hypothetical protein
VALLAAPFSVHGVPSVNTGSFLALRNRTHCLAITTGPWVQPQDLKHNLALGAILWFK